MTNKKRMALSDAYWFQEGPGVRKWQFTSAGVKLLNVANITKLGVLDLSKTERHLSEDEVEQKYSHFLADEGDLVIASSGISFDEDGLLRTRGAFIEARHLPLCMNTSTIRFKAKDGVSDLNFLRHWIDSVEFRRQISQLVTGTAQQNFGPSHLKSVEIFLSPLAEQIRIAAVLDEADALRQKRREVSRKLDALLWSLFLQTFGDPTANPIGWATDKFASLLSIPLRNGISPSSIGKHRGKVLTLSAITRGAFNAKAVKEASFADEAVAEKLINSLDFLMCRGNGNLEMVGRAHFPIQTLHDTVFPDTMIAARVDKGKVNPQYLEVLWAMPGIRRQIESAARTTNGTYKVNQGMLEAIEIMLPPLALQKEFGRKVTEINVMREQSEVALSQTEALFTTLQYQAFHSQSTDVTQAKPSLSPCLTLDF